MHSLKPAQTFFVEPPSVGELGRVATEIAAPQIVNIVFGGRTPDPGREAIAKMGFSIALYANAAVQAALRGAADVLGALKSNGSLASVADKLADFEERQRTVEKGAWDALEKKYIGIYAV